MPWSDLSARPARLDASAGLAVWYEHLLSRVGGSGDTLRQACLGGFHAATPGLAFMSGYQAALRALWPQAPATLGALCVTEQRSTRPADMATRLSEGRLQGRKDFVSAGLDANWLLVAAREEAAGEAVRIAMLVLDIQAPGLRLETLPALPMMPDIGHARLWLDDVPAERLPGEGYADYVKPFRSLEDVHVLAALSAWLLGVGRESQWPQALQLRLLAQLAGCAQVVKLAPDAASTHVLLGGLFAQHQSLVADLDAALADGPAHWQGVWQRDRMILQVAESARRKRLEKAWQIFDPH